MIARYGGDRRFVTALLANKDYARENTAASRAGAGRALNAV